MLKQYLNIQSNLKIFIAISEYNFKNKLVFNFIFMFVFTFHFKIVNYSFDEFAVNFIDVYSYLTLLFIY